VVNDRADVASAAEASGVSRSGKRTWKQEAARAVVGANKLLGVQHTTSNNSRRRRIFRGLHRRGNPFFATGTKANPDPVVGTQFIQRVRPLTDKPIVAIGGITLTRAPEIIESGADSVAVISDILGAPEPGMRAKQYIDLLDPLTTRLPAEAIRRMADTTHPLADTRAKSEPGFVRAIGLF